MNTEPIEQFSEQNRVGVKCVPAGGELIGYYEIWAYGDGGIVLRNHDGGAHCFFASAPESGVNFVEARGAVSGDSPELKAIGMATNVPLRLVPRGTAPVQMPFIEIQTKSGGVTTTHGFIGRHCDIFGGTCEDIVIRVEPGRKLRYFIGGTETDANGVPK